LRSNPVIAVIRATDPTLAMQQAAYCLQAGIDFVEITSTTPEFLQIIRQLRQQYPTRSIGVGTVLQAATARAALQAGAQFVVSPVCLPDVLQLAQVHQVPVVPGALTPQEIWQALQAGATAVKIFPVDSVGGGSYIRHLTKPLGSLPLIATGGVTLANSLDLLRCGALAVGIGSDLFPPDWRKAEPGSSSTQRIQAWLMHLQGVKGARREQNLD
jgi:2-dehydro-3-deoxyphosphogluconate aldolase/(4S)-4-hydroxy-2-oxoglutarate aldolase